MFQIVRFRDAGVHGNVDAHHARFTEEYSLDGEYFWLQPNEMPFIYTVGGIVICGTIDLCVSKCGRFGACYLQVFIVTLHTFKCEQELNSTCSRRTLAQHTRCCRHALLSNARLTFTTPRSF
jgi:hypothetical protein